MSDVCVFRQTSPCVPLWSYWVHACKSQHDLLVFITRNLETVDRWLHLSRQQFIWNCLCLHQSYVRVAGRWRWWWCLSGCVWPVRRHQTLQYFTRRKNHWRLERSPKNTNRQDRWLITWNNRDKASERSASETPPEVWHHSVFWCGSRISHMCWWFTSLSYSSNHTVSPHVLLDGSMDETVPVGREMFHQWKKLITQSNCAVLYWLQWPFSLMGQLDPNHAGKMPWKA